MYVLQSSFAGGEFSPSLQARTDLQKYTIGSAKLRNFTVRPHGGAATRPGTYFVAHTKYYDKATRVIPFQFSTVQSYVLEVGHQYIRFYMNGGQIIGDDDLIYEIESPYDEQDVNLLKYAQSADVLYIVHPRFAPMTLIRYDHADWELVAYNNKNGPFKPGNYDSGKKITPSAVSGAITLDSNFDYFDPLHIGSLFRISHDVDGQMISSVFTSPGLGAQITGSLDEGQVSAMVYCQGTYRVILSGYNGSVTLEKSTDGISGWTTVTTFITNDNTGTIANFAYIRLRCVTGNPQPDPETSPPSIGFALSGDQYLKTQGSWTLLTHGTWTGKVKVEISKDYGVTWKTYRSFSSKNDSNVNMSGSESEFCWIRINCYEFTSGSLSYDFSTNLYTRDGIVRITAVTDQRHATATGISELGDTIATDDWAEGSWSELNGYPSSVIFYPDRLCYAGTVGEPQTIWMSKLSEYEDFGKSTPLEDTDAISVPLSSRQINKIENMISLDRILALTSGSEWVVGPASDGALTPTNPSARCQGYRGSSTVAPVVIGNRAIYVQAMGSTVRDLGYDFASNAFIGDDISIFSNHLLKGYQIMDMAYAQEPDSIVWFIRSDGMLLGLTYMPEQQVVAWHHHVTDGAFQSVCTIPGDGYTESWFVVRRGDQQFIERMAKRAIGNDVTDYFCVDCGLRYDGEPVQIIEGLNHLDGKTVAIVADGFVLPRQTVVDGSITLEIAASSVQVGLPYTCAWESLDANITAGDGATHPRMATIPEVTIFFEKSRGGFIGTDPDPEKLDELIQRSYEPWDTPIDLIDGSKLITLPSAYNSRKRIYFEQRDPLPVTLVGIVPKVIFGG